MEKNKFFGLSFYGFKEIEKNLWELIRFSNGFLSILERFYLSYSDKVPFVSKISIR